MAPLIASEHNACFIGSFVAWMSWHLIVEPLIAVTAFAIRRITQLMSISHIKVERETLSFAAATIKFCVPRE